MCDSKELLWWSIHVWGQTMSALLTCAAISAFSICTLALLHSYLFFPLYLQLAARRKCNNPDVYSRTDALPLVSILMSAYNEQSVIESKILSVYQTDYPAERIEVLVGSDASSDGTDKILSMLSARFPSLQFHPFNERSGKGMVIERLVRMARGDVLILTDANVLFEPGTIYTLVRHFRNGKIGLVDTHMVSIGLRADGISNQEKAYVSRECLIKNREGKLWGTMIGPAGGCFAVRKGAYPKVPESCIVEDFYVNMAVLRSGYQAINDLDARVFEPVSNELAEEFRRKTRIARGNFQNLRWFSDLLYSDIPGLSFCFLSHKVLRWFGPFLLLGALVSSILAARGHAVFAVTSVAQTCALLLPVFDWLLRRAGLHIGVLRLASHFYGMNLALLVGFFLSLRPPKQAFWTPTKRPQIEAHTQI